MRQLKVQEDQNWQDGSLSHEKPANLLEVKRSIIMVTRPVHVHTVNAQYLPNGKAYEIETW